MTDIQRFYYSSWRILAIRNDMEGHGYDLQVDDILFSIICSTIITIKYFCSAISKDGSGYVCVYYGPCFLNTCALLCAFHICNVFFVLVFIPS